MVFSGAIRRKGSVDGASTVSDSLDVEKARGISVRTSSSSFVIDDVLFNLIDTPGHVDFSAEVERCLTILDGALVLISAVEGIQSHTVSLWNALDKLRVPRLIFINKTDRQGSDYHRVLHQIQAELGLPVFPLNAVRNEGEPSIELVDLFSDNTLSHDEKELYDIAIESLAGIDEEFFDACLEGNPFNKKEIFKILAPRVQKNEICPVIFGSAKYDQGTEYLIQAAKQFFIGKPRDSKKPLSAIIYKIEHDKLLGRLAHVCLFSGTLFPRETIWNERLKRDMKLTRLMNGMGGKRGDQPYLLAGDVGIISGLMEARAGDILGNPADVPLGLRIQEPVLSVQVNACEKEETHKLSEALYELNVEDPLLKFTWYKSKNEMQLSLMGPMQIEILQQVLENRFRLKTEFSEPEIIYKETPVQSAEGFVEYTMPKPCWAVMKFRIEPGKPGSGVVYTSELSFDKIRKKYQNEIEASISKSLKQGIRGWEVTDIKITLAAGEDHEIHSRPGDFVLATPMGIMQGLQNSGTRLLEPFYHFDIHAPEKDLGSIVSDLTRMRARFDSPLFDGESFDIRGEVPVSESYKYSIRLSSTTGGQGRLKIRFGGYQPCPEGKGTDLAYQGVSPLNKSQWILQHRGAFKADERRSM